MIGEDLRSGRLVPLLTNYSQESSDIPAVYLARHNLPAKLRAFIDFLAAHFAPIPPWERMPPEHVAAIGK